MVTLKQQCSSENPATCRYHGKPNPRTTPGVYTPEGKIKPVKSLTEAEKGEYLKRKAIHKNVTSLVSALNKNSADREYRLDDKPVIVTNQVGLVRNDFNDYARIVYKPTNYEGRERVLGIVNLKTGDISPASDKNTINKKVTKQNISTSAGLETVKNFVKTFNQL